MLTNAALPSFDLSIWRTAKAILGGGVFLAMSLPIAFPAKDLPSVLAQHVAMRVPPSAVAAKPAAAGPKAKPASQTKAATTDLPARKPPPKDGAPGHWLLALR